MKRSNFRQSMPYTSVMTPKNQRTIFPPFDEQKKKKKIKTAGYPPNGVEIFATCSGPSLIPRL